MTDKQEKRLRFAVGDKAAAIRGRARIDVEIVAIGAMHLPAAPCDYSVRPIDNRRKVFGRQSNNKNNVWSVFDEDLHPLLEVIEGEQP